MLLGKYNIDITIALAPMAGWSDSVYRQTCKDFGANLFFTEMASADAIVRGHQTTLNLISFTDKERPIGIQLFGSDAETLSRAVHMISEKSPDFIDLNLGCPARKVVRHGAGSALLRDLDKLNKIACSFVNSAAVPCTAKVRSGWDSVNVIETCRILQQAGFSMITVHPRTQKMQFSGKADWELIGQVKAAVKIPVIGNGDIKSAEDAGAMMEMTGCDGIMVGRAARGNPWIFKQINDLLHGYPPQVPSYEARLSVCISHLNHFSAFYGKRNKVVAMRKHIAAYLKGMPNSSALKEKIFTAQDIETIIKTLELYPYTEENHLHKIAMNS